MYLPSNLETFFKGVGNLPTPMSSGKTGKPVISARNFKQLSAGKPKKLKADKD